MNRIIYKVGGTFETRVGVVTIVKVYPLGTVDVVSAAGDYFRVTGLPLFE